MHDSISILRHSFILIALLLVISCTAGVRTGETTLVGSTPGDAPIKAMLGIPAATMVDFIRWELRLLDNERFQLKIVYGESQPNTLGFKGGGAKGHYEGHYQVSPHSQFPQVLQLNGDGLLPGITLAKLNENIFHIVGPNQRLIQGNGGWSYTLQRREPIAPNTIPLSSSVQDDPGLRWTFEGRTPCREIAKEHPEMKVSGSCFKLKWLLVLHRDSVSGQPTTYQLRKVVDNQPREVTGRWIIQKGSTANPQAVWYILQSAQAGQSITLLAVDEHILLFLNAQGEPFIGNQDFSYTLNKRQAR